MRRADLEHTIRAATEIIAQDAILIIGSQAILCTYSEAQLPAEATMSFEVDMAPLDDDDAESLATRIDGILGEWSLFHQTHGYYVQGVSTTTARLPRGWAERLVRVSGANTNGRVGLCLDAHDICLSKLVAHREKDLRFVGTLIEAKLIDLSVLKARLDDMDLDGATHRRLYDPSSLTSDEHWRTSQEWSRPSAPRPGGYRARGSPSHSPRWRWAHAQPAATTTHRRTAATRRAPIIYHPGLDRRERPTAVRTLHPYRLR